jgi:nucleoside-triphosphatase THEP1
MRKSILLTGSPGCGKTTLIQKVLLKLSIPASGFYTREIRQQGVRKGFEIITLDGKRDILSHVNIKSPKRVGKYGVDLDMLLALAVPAIYQGIKSGGLIVIDEIGPMEILSSYFRQAVLEALDSDSSMLGTIVRRSTPFTDSIKARPEVTTIEVTPNNRDALLDHLLTQFREISLTSGE